jgi:acetoin utilization deacetylase AcuC-like enzyme
VKPVGLILDPLCLEHSNGSGHPESPARLRAIQDMLESFPLRDRLARLQARDAGFEELARVHAPDYIRRIEATRGRQLTVLDPDTSACPASYAAALRAAGGVLAAVEAVLGGGYAGAFAAVRPPGHHAEADRAMGFCLFNNAAVAARAALERHGLRRALLVDWDVHHGNGSMHSFYDSPEVLYFSVHQYPHYPGTGGVEETGRGRGAGYTVNVPLPGGQGDAEYLAVFRELLRPLALDYRPELIVISAGFDVHRDDPLADMQVTEAGFGGMTRVLVEVAEACCPGRLVFALEGGYDLDALSSGVAAVLRALLGEEPRTEGQPEADQATRSVLDRLRVELAPFWPALRGGRG